MDRRIEVFHAQSSKEYIRFYSNRYPECYYEGKIISETQAIGKWIKEEMLNKEVISSDETKVKNKVIEKIKSPMPFSIDFYRRLVIEKFVLKSIVSTLILSGILGIYYYNVGYINMNVFIMLACLCIGVISLIMEITICLSQFLALYNQQYAKKSKHAAEHKLVNILEKLQRLPNDLDEIQKMTRFNKNCGRPEAKQLNKNYAQGILNAFSYLLCSLVILLTGKRMGGVSLLLLVLCIIIVRLLLEHFLLQHFTLMISMFFQVASTAKEPEENDLLLAWCIAEEWMKEEYPEYFQEN